MILEYNYDTLWGEKKLSINSHAESLSVCGDAAAGHLMRKFIYGGSSIITYGKSDYYMHIHDVSPSSIATVGYDEIIRDCKLPYIKDSCNATCEEIKKSFEDYEMYQKYSYMSKRKDGQSFYDPQMFQSFYQIQRGNTVKERFFTESFLLNILSQCLYVDGQHEITLFLTMPFKPITATMLDVMEKVQDGYINLICIYKNENESNSKYTFISDGTKCLLRCPKRSFYIKDEQV